MTARIRRASRSRSSRLLHTPPAYIGAEQDLPVVTGAMVGTIEEVLA